MNLKSYIRGIGIGILVTAAVFLVAGSKDKKMSDAEVIARARELGMVESQTLSSISNVVSPEAKPTEEVVDTKEVAQTTEAVAEEPETTEAVKEDDVMADEAITTDPTKEAEEEGQAAEEAKKAEEEKKAAEEAKKAEEEKKAAEEAKKAEEEKKAAEEAKKAEEEKKKAEASPNADDSDTVVIVVNSGEGSDTVARKLYEAGIVPNAHEFDLFLMANGYDRKITTGNHIISKNATDDEIGKNLVSSTR